MVVVARSRGCLERTAGPLVAHIHVLHELRVRSPLVILTRRPSSAPAVLSIYAVLSRKVGKAANGSGKRLLSNNAVYGCKTPSNAVLGCKTRSSSTAKACRQEPKLAKGTLALLEAVKSHPAFRHRGAAGFLLPSLPQSCPGFQFSIILFGFNQVLLLLLLETG